MQNGLQNIARSEAASPGSANSTAAKGTGGSAFNDVGPRVPGNAGATNAISAQAYPVSAAVDIIKQEVEISQGQHLTQLSSEVPMKTEDLPSSTRPKKHGATSNPSDIIVIDDADTPSNSAKISTLRNRDAWGTKSMVSASS